MAAVHLKKPPTSRHGLLVAQRDARASHEVSERGATIVRQGVVPGSLKGQERVNYLA
jgi:hypothetical protein